MLYTVMPIEQVLSPFVADGGDPLPVLAAVDGVQVLIVPSDAGRGRIERVLSTDPADYLNPSLAPGTVVDMPRPNV
ncbi:MAG: YlzJ-like family protein [Clostridia bacterium]|nr:YlzJ-like family protein [Clostridia bacterium]